MYLFFDTETTGLPKRWNAPVTDLENWPRLVQLAWIMYDDRGNMLESRIVSSKARRIYYSSGSFAGAWDHDFGGT